jgi:hypothetical protein
VLRSRCVIPFQSRCRWPIGESWKKPGRQKYGGNERAAKETGEALRVRSVDREFRSTHMAEENLSGRLNEGEEYEEITSDEVDRVVEQLERLMETVSSENIKSYLEDAVNNIFFLLYDDEDCADAA